MSSRRTFLISAGAAAFAGLGRASAETQQPAQATADAGGVVRLDRNENPYGPSPRVVDAIRDSMQKVSRYPRSETDLLADRIAAMHHVKRDQVVLGCGSTDILRMAAGAFLGPDKQLMQATPTYEVMESYARAASAKVISIPITHRYAHDVAAILAHTTPATGLVYVCNPNNPTATLTPREELESLVEKLPPSTYIVIDEAYHHYAGQSAEYASFIDRPVDNPRLIATRTFSIAYGLAGLRVGYAVTSAETARKLQAYALENRVNDFAIRAAMAALDDADSLRDFVARNQNDRQEFFNQALARAVKPIHSDANFIMLNMFHPAD
jgi:histidinol-phosphate aminotransferase